MSVTFQDDFSTFQNAYNYETKILLIWRQVFIERCSAIARNDHPRLCVMRLKPVIDVDMRPDHRFGMICFQRIPKITAVSGSHSHCTIITESRFMPDRKKMLCAVLASVCKVTCNPVRRHMRVLANRVGVHEYKMRVFQIEG